MHVDVVSTLARHGGFPCDRPVRRRIVVAHEQPRLGRQVKQLAHRAVQGVRIAARKIAAGGAHIWHEQGVAHEHGVTDPVGHAGGRVTRYRQRLRRESADRKVLAVEQQAVELVAVGPEFILQIEDALEYVLHMGDPGADGNLASQLLPQVVRSGQMIRVGMGFKNPLHAQAPGLDESNELVG